MSSSAPMVFSNVTSRGLILPMASSLALAASIAASTASSEACGERSNGGSETIESWRSAILSNLAQSAENSASGARLMVGEEQATSMPVIARSAVRKIMRCTLPPAAGCAQADSGDEYPGRPRLAKRGHVHAPGLDRHVGRHVVAAVPKATRLGPGVAVVRFRQVLDHEARPA